MEPDRLARPPYDLTLTELLELSSEDRGRYIVNKVAHFEGLLIEGAAIASNGLEDPGEVGAENERNLDLEENLREWLKRVEAALGRNGTTR